MNQEMFSFRSNDGGNDNRVTEYAYVTNENNIHKKSFDHRSGSPYNEYSYDTLDRLTEADYLVGTLTEVEVFTMDDLGNRTNVNLRSGTD